MRAGVPGEVTAQALRGCPPRSTSMRHGLLLCIGGNDFLRRLGNQQAEKRARYGEARAKPRRCGAPRSARPSRATVSPPAFYAGIAKEYRLPYEGGILGEVLKDHSLKAIPSTPTRGYRLIAERLAEMLRKSGAI